MQHVWPLALWGGAPWSNTTLCCTLLERSRRADVKLWLTCNAATYHFGDIRGHAVKIGVWDPPEPLSWPSIWWALNIFKILPPKGEDRSGTQFYHNANFNADWRHRRRDILGRTKTYTPDLMYDKTHTSVCVCRSDRKHCTISATSEILVDSITVVCLRLLTVGDSVVLFFFSFLSFFLFNFIRCPCNVFDVIVSP